MFKSLIKFSFGRPWYLSGSKKDAIVSLFSMVDLMLSSDKLLVLAIPFFLSSIHVTVNDSSLWYWIFSKAPKREFTSVPYAELKWN